jgi:hypothetical protein
MPQTLPVNVHLQRDDLPQSLLANAEVLDDLDLAQLPSLLANAEVPDVQDLNANPKNPKNLKNLKNLKAQLDVAPENAVKPKYSHSFKNSFQFK